jgi:hypothetical protein
MPVYVDDMKADFKGYVMCHMIADTTEELLAMADIIGAAHKYIQHPGTPKEHFDIPLERREIAVAHGAVEITRRQAVAIIRAKRAMAVG